MSTQRIDLATNYSISRILKGGWQLAGGHGTIDRQSALHDMFQFVKKGITTFDCADIYTGVEELIGEFLKKHGNKNIQVHTKYVPDLDSLDTLTKNDVEDIIDRSLKRLGVDQLDVVQFHWWDYRIPRYSEVAEYLHILQKKGKIKHIGVTNFNTEKLTELVQAGIPIISCQVQYSVLDRRVEKSLVQVCKKYNIKLLCYGTVAGGFLSGRYIGKKEPEEPLENRSLTKYKLIIDDFGGWDVFQELLKVLEKIAQKHSVSITNVANKYVLDKPQVAGVIIGARNTTHLADTIRVFDFELDQEDTKDIDKIIGESKGLSGDFYDLERDKEGKHGRIMKYNLNKTNI